MADRGFVISRGAMAPDLCCRAAPSSAFGTFSPAEKRGGEGRPIESFVISSGLALVSATCSRSLIKRVKSSRFCKAPSSAFGTFSPAEKRGGEGRSIESLLVEASVALALVAGN
jgi:hypothetical protein